MRVQHLRCLLVGAAAIALGACGGGGGGIASTPFVPAPDPVPTPTSGPPPIPAGPLGLVSDQPFATYSAYNDGAGTLLSGEGGVQFSYSPQDNTYTVKLPGYDEGRVVPLNGNGSYDESGWIHLSSTWDGVTLGNSDQLQPVNLTLDWPQSSDFTYTSFGRWVGGQSSQAMGYFVYGIPTAPGGVPVTGSANYGGEIRGLTDGGLDVWGSITFAFDFGAGALSGEMRPQYSPDGWDSYSLGTYTFRDTVYSNGSTTFSGAFNRAGLDGTSSFTGRFNGPNGSEVMGSWNAPFSDPAFNISGNMAGVFAAKKSN